MEEATNTKALPDTIECSIDLAPVVLGGEKFTVTDIATRTPVTRSPAKLTSKGNPTSYSAVAL